MNKPKRVSTGSLVLDTALAGGWPAGAFVHLFVGPNEHASFLYNHVLKTATQGLLISTSMPDVTQFESTNHLLVLYEAGSELVLEALRNLDRLPSKYDALVVDALEQIHVPDSENESAIELWFRRWRFYEQLAESHTSPGANLIVRHKYVTSGSPNRFMVESFADIRGRTQDTLRVAIGHQGFVDAVVNIPLLATGGIDTRLELHRLTRVSAQKLRAADDGTVALLADDYRGGLLDVDNAIEGRR